MKTWMISTLSMMALALMFTGCGEEGSASSSSYDGSQTPVTTNEHVVVNGKVTSEDVNSFGLSSELGMPPVHPGQ